MNKDVCKRCLDTTMGGWTEGDELMWEVYNGISCPHIPLPEGEWSHRHPLAQEEPPPECPFYLEQIVMGQQDEQTGLQSMPVQAWFDLGQH